MGDPGLVDLPHSGDRSWNWRCSGQRSTHEICDTALYVIFRHMQPHRGKDVLEAGFGGQLVPMLDDLVTQLPVAGVGLVHQRGLELLAVSI